MNHIELLTLLGYSLTNHVEESWEDDGDAENGPHLTGGPAFDEWTRPGDSHAVIVIDGGVVAVEPNSSPF